YGATWDIRVENGPNRVAERVKPPPAAIPSGRAARRRLTLFTTILTLFLSVAVLVGAAVTIVTYFQIRESTDKSASNTFGATIERINERRIAFFAPVFLMIQLLRSDPALHQDADGSKQQILQLVLPALEMNPQISAIYVGYGNGDFFHVLSLTDGEQGFLERLGAPPAT